ncbi:hypothetical protein UAY_02733 [Enterococcus moraviensis ATCC BAA-383]|uniref:WxL domain-containing protein n=1 Tax=Enterococcus moraviensis ATCC BAA-383 TaxID=1158609 RepID=R2SW41_9ENTE|nr:WxL domain-containing protein [Enterococcus moraviensis]EOH97001.1 hypothetical protein UAY_02733 [Enterococcus moraviensis ATCC BAA-383]EOT65791.1 hypothetical protein I586_02060 [Enterococcus moraviensis ATCC BAA-383]OJG68438.1 hypothetical protein RV09_GL001685 [Enterococcus moraviensis]
MKKIQVLSGLGACAIALTLFAGTSTTAQAAPLSETTDATVTFDENDGGVNPGDNGLIIPGSPDENIYVPDGEGKSTTGPLRFTNIPALKFGTVKIKSTGANYESQMSLYQKSLDGKVPPAADAKLKIPHFVQVADERGGTGQFEVKVSATTFTSGTKELKNSRIQLYNGEVRNSSLDMVSKDNDATALLETPALIAKNTPVTIPTEAANSISILKVKAGQSANASISSVVFSQGYTSDADYSDVSTNPYVQLNVPQGEQPEKETYTATLTWELSDTI